MKYRKDGIVIRQPNDNDFDSILDLRWRVLDKPVDSPRQTEPTKNDVRPDVIHMEAFEENVAISTVRLDPYPERGEHIYLVRRMATDPKFQRRGIGTDVLIEAERITASRGATRIILHSRPGSVVFYESLGYKLNGRIEIHNGDENPEMEKNV